MFTYKQIQSLNELEMEVYNYVITHLEQVAFMKIRELAEHTHVSTSTVLRFCNKIGCDGYSEFKLRVKMLQEQRVSSSFLETPPLIMEFFKKCETKEFDDLLNQAADMIFQAKKVVFYGIGSSGILGKYGARFFSNVGVYAQYLDDPFYPYPQGYFDKLVVIVLSVKGEQRTVIDQITGYKAQRSQVISLTNAATSTIAKMADLNISYYMPLNIVGKEYNITSQIPVIYILETIGRKIQLRLAEEQPESP